MSAIQAAGAWVRDLVFLPDPDLPGPHDFVRVAEPPADYQNDECSICTASLFNTPLDADYPQIHKSVVAHRPRGRGIGRSITCHIHLECLERAMLRKEECPACRTVVSRRVVATIARNVLPRPPPPSLRQRVVRWSRQMLKEAQNTGLKALIISTTIAASCALLGGVILGIGSFGYGIRPEVFSITSIAYWSTLPGSAAGSTIGIFISDGVNKITNALIPTSRLRLGPRMIVRVVQIALAALIAYKIWLLVASAFSASIFAYMLSSSQTQVAVDFLAKNYFSTTDSFILEGLAHGLPRLVLVAAMASRNFNFLGIGVGASFMMLNVAGAFPFFDD